MYCRQLVNIVEKYSGDCHERRSMIFVWNGSYTNESPFVYVVICAIRFGNTGYIKSRSKLLLLITERSSENPNRHDFF